VRERKVPQRQRHRGVGDVIDRDALEARDVEAGLVPDLDDLPPDAGGIERDRPDVLDVGDTNPPGSGSLCTTIDVVAAAGKA
jgi:hypothetical protein